MADVKIFLSEIYHECNFPYFPEALLVTHNRAFATLAKFRCDVCGQRWVLQTDKHGSPVAVRRGRASRKWRKTRREEILAGADRNTSHT